MNTPGGGDERAELASRPVRAVAPAPDLGRLQHARLGQRSRGRGAAVLAPTRPQPLRRHQRLAGVRMPYPALTPARRRRAPPVCQVQSTTAPPVKLISLAV